MHTVVDSSDTARGDKFPAGLEFSTDEECQAEELELEAARLTAK